MRLIRTQLTMMIEGDTSPYQNRPSRAGSSLEGLGAVWDAWMSDKIISEIRGPHQPSLWKGAAFLERQILCLVERKPLTKWHRNSQSWKGPWQDYRPTALRAQTLESPTHVSSGERRPNTVHWQRRSQLWRGFGNVGVLFVETLRKRGGAEGSSGRCFLETHARPVKNQRQEAQRVSLGG